LTIGLIIRDRVSGLETLRVVDRLGRILGTFQTGPGAGSISIPEFATAQGWVVPRVIEQATNRPTTAPVFVVSSSGISWTFPGTTSEMPAVSCYATYGVF